MREQVSNTIFSKEIVNTRLPEKFVNFEYCDAKYSFFIYRGKKNVLVRESFWISLAWGASEDVFFLSLNLLDYERHDFHKFFQDLSVNSELNNQIQSILNTGEFLKVTKTRRNGGDLSYAGHLLCELKAKDVRHHVKRCNVEV